MGCCASESININGNGNKNGKDDDGGNVKDKDSSMVIITFNTDANAALKNKRKDNYNDYNNDNVESDNDDEDDEDYNMIVEYIIDENGNRVKVVKRVKAGDKGDDDNDELELDIDNLSEAQKAKMSPNELLIYNKTKKMKMEQTKKMKEEAKKEYLKNKDVLDPVEKSCTVRINYFKPKVILAEYSIKIHKDIINCIIPIKDLGNILYATCSDDKTIKFWSADFDLIDEVETMHQPNIILQYNSQCLLSAENDAIISYDLGSYAEVLVFKGHMRKINSIALMADKFFASGGDDHLIRIWDINSDNDNDIDSKEQQCLKYFDGHTASIIKIIALGSDTMVSCSEDKSVIVWDSKTLIVIVKMNNYFTTIGLVNIDNGFLLGAYDNKVRVYRKDIQMLQVLKGKYYNVKHVLVIEKDYLAISNSTKKVYIIDRDYKSIEYIYKGQRSLITGMVSHRLSKQFVTSGDDGKVYIWTKPIKQD